MKETRDPWIDKMDSWPEEDPGPGAVSSAPLKRWRFSGGFSGYPDPWKERNDAGSLL